MTDAPASTVPATTPPPAGSEVGAGGKPVPDRELLRRFVKLADQAAFAALVRRHSGLVIGVCRRVLRSEHDIEDAFQATFLVLARDAGRIRKTDSLASWLHGVAYRTSLRAADSTRRRGRLWRELTMIDDTLTPADDSGPLADVEQRHQQQALDEELASLPDNYRAALVLHYLDGKSNQQVADELGLSVTAVEGRLKRGKKELRLRLARRGVGLSVAVAAMQAVESSAQAAPLEPLIARAIDAGLSYAGGEAAGPVYSPEAARLAGQELMTMSTTTTATLAAVVLLPLALGFAGHAPVAGPAGTPAVISTTLAQAAPTESSEQLSDPATEGIAEGDSVPPAEQELEARVEAALASQTSFAFDNVPLYEAINQLESQHGIPISILLPALKMVNASPEMRVSGSAENVPLGEALEALLKPHHLGASILENGLSITAAPSAEWERRNRERKKIVEAHLAKEKPQRFDERSPNSIRIEAELHRESNVEFVDTPLHEAIDFIASLHNIRILIDEPALEDVGIPTDIGVRLILNGVTLQSVLNRILQPRGLATIIRDEVLQVTTKEVADEYLVTRVYDISDLAGIEQDQLLKVLQESLPDAYWMDTDGAGGTASILDDALVVKQSQSAHRQIVDLLGQLRRHLQQRSQSSDSQTYEDSRSGKAAEASRGRIVGKVSGRRTGHTKNVEDVEVPIGSEEGLREGDELVIYSSSGSSLKPIARVRVYEVTPHTARAHVFSQVDGTEIQMGDSVGLDPIFGRELTPQGGPGAAEAADSELNPGSHELTLQIEADGRARYDGRPVSIVQLQELLQKEQPSLLILRVDRSASSQAVSDIVEAAKAAGNPGMKFAMRGVDPNAAAPASTHEPE